MKHEHHRLADIGEDNAAAPHGSDDRGEGVVEQHHVPCLPVLSVQMMCVAPNVSTDGSLLVRALRLAIRRMPRARATVATMGGPSGMAATPSARAVAIIFHENTTKRLLFFHGDLRLGRSQAGDGQPVRRTADMVEAVAEAESH